VLPWLRAQCLSIDGNLAYVDKVLQWIEAQLSAPEVQAVNLSADFMMFDEPLECGCLSLRAKT
jgi:hypothetical protein